MALDTEQLKVLPTLNGTTLGDQLALTIGTLGENASLRRAICFKGDTGVKIVGYAHPSTQEPSQIMLGRFGAILAYKSQNDENSDKISRQICQHIVGINPKKIGSDKDEPNKSADDETCLIYQDFVMDEGFKVGEIMKEYGIDVIDFKRIECGENEEVFGAQRLENVETCQ